MIENRFDTILVGVVTGTVVPIVTFFILYVVFEELTQLGIISSEGFSEGFRVRTLSLVSIGANVILVRYFQNRYAFKSVRGVVFPTFVYIIGWIFYFSSILIS